MNFVKELLLAFVTVTVVVLMFHYSFDNNRLVFRTIILHSIESGIGVTLGIASIKLIRLAYNKQRNKHIA
jgi:hypothetical protein